jgi:hypothetical protein
VTVLPLPFGRLVCSSTTSSICYQPTHRAVFHPGASFFNASATLTDDLAVSNDLEFLLLVLIWSVDHAVIWVNFEDLVVKALLKF